jgi:hypothetical protein
MNKVCCKAGKIMTAQTYLYKFFNTLEIRFFRQMDFLNQKKSFHICFHTYIKRKSIKSKNFLIKHSKTKITELFNTSLISFPNITKAILPWLL